MPYVSSAATVEKDLQPGVAFHAFDHLGSIGEQAETAAACGANIIYVSGLGALGYQGLPPEAELVREEQRVSDYVLRAKHRGIRLAIGYVCATSIVNLNTFDRNWFENVRRQFKTPPSDWRQMDRNGKALKSWYGGDYEPACMNNPDWRAYEKFMITRQLAAGCDGIFFDNPTVHPDGCYCAHCMADFEAFLKGDNGSITRLCSEASARQARRNGAHSHSSDLASLREYAAIHPQEFMQFRCTIARDFLAEMKAHARSIRKDALITANNSLNSPDVLFSQCRRYAYNIYEMSKTEDFVVVEDESSQPRLLPNGNTLEYTPTYKQLNAISHGKPVAAVTIADGDYHTPPDLVRLAMAEAAANGASYLAWPTWPESKRQQMIERIKPQAVFMQQNAALYRRTKPRADVVLFSPFRNWLQTGDCAPSRLAAELTRANIQYEVICEDNFRPTRPSVLLADPRDFNDSERKAVKEFTQSGGTLVATDDARDAQWMTRLKQALRTPSITLDTHKNIRAIVCDQSRRTLVHLLNLNIRKISSFEDNVTLIENIRLGVQVPLRKVRSIRLLTADQSGPAQRVQFSTRSEDGMSLLDVSVPRLEIAAILVIE